MKSVCCVDLNQPHEKSDEVFNPDPSFRWVQFESGIFFWPIRSLGNLEMGDLKTMGFNTKMV